MTQTTVTRESGPGDDASPPKKRRLLPKILIGVAVDLPTAAVAVVAATIATPASASTSGSRTRRPGNFEWIM